MRDLRMAEGHACAMPDPKPSKWRHAMYLCDCGAGWRVTWGHSGGVTQWHWEQIL